MTAHLPTLTARDLVVHGTILTLEEVRDDVRRQTAAEAYLDPDRNVRLTHLAFSAAGHPTVRFLDAQGAQVEELAINDHALTQFAQVVLPSGIRTLRDLQDLAGRGEHKAKLATLAWNSWVSEHDGARRLFRHIQPVILDGGKWVPRGPRMVRAVLSTSYALYSDEAFLDDLLSAWGPVPVPWLRRTDEGLRLRMILDTEGAEYERFVEAYQPGQHTFMEDGAQPRIAVAEGWNSEIGTTSTGLAGGAYFLRCHNGAIRYEKGDTASWRHVGNPERIRQGVEGATTDIKARAAGVIDAYNAALDIAIDDAEAWLEAEIMAASTGIPQAAVARVVQALDDPTTAPGRKLISCVDAITLAAQQEGIWQQREMERVAVRVLERGLDAAKGTGRLYAPRPRDLDRPLEALAK